MKILLLLIVFIATLIVLPDNAQAMNGWRDGRYPYGDYCPMQGWYGAKKPVKTAKEAKKILQEYFKNEPVLIGNIKEREWFLTTEKGTVLLNDKTDDAGGK